MPPPLPPGFVLAPPTSAPPAAPGGHPTLTPLGPPHQPAPPSGYQAAPGGLAPIPGGPAEQPPTGYRYKPDHTLEPIPGGPADTSPHLGPPPGNAALHGDAYLSSLDPGLADRVRALSDGRLQVPTGRALAVPYWQTTLAAALQYDPTLDEANARTRIATRHSRAVGPIGANITALNTAIGHLGRLANRADELGNGEFTPWNALRNTVTSAFGNTAPGNFQADVQAASDELEKAFRMSGGGSLEGIRGWQERLSSASTPEQLHGVINEITGLLHSRIVAIGQQYDAGMGRSSDPLQLVSPEARAVLDAIHRNQPVPDNLIAATTGLPADPNAPPPPAGPGNPPQGGGTPPAGGLSGLLHDVGAPPPDPHLGQQIASAPSGSDERFQMLERYHNATAGRPRVSVALGRHADPATATDQFGVTDNQAQALEREYQMAVRARAIAARAAAEPTGVSPVDILPPVLLARMAARALSGDEAANAVQRGATDTLTMGGADEATAALASAGGNGTYDENVAIQRGIADYDSRNHPVSRAAGQLTAGLALPIGEAPTLGRLALAGGGYGAAYGFGSGEGVTDRLLRAGEGGASGAILGPAIKVGADAAGSTFRALRGLVSGRSGPVADAGGVAAQDLIAAAGRQSVDVLPADVSGPGVRRLTAGMAQLPFGSGPIVNAAQRTTDQVASRVGDIAATEGAPVRQEALGTVASNAAQGYIDRSGAEGRRLYDVARNAAGGATASADGAIAALDSHIAELSSTPNTSAPQLSALQGLRADLANEAGGGKLDIDTLRRLRTDVRAQAQQEGLRGTDFQRRAGDVLTHLSEDVANSLTPEAAGAFREADAHWAHRLNVIDDVMSSIIGPQGDRSAEQVAGRLVSMSRSDSGRLKTFIDHATSEEAGVVRSSLINELGRAPSGQQGAEGDKFSLSTFLTNWDRLPERSRNVLFRGESRAAIEDLATIAEGSREAGKYANRSNTGGAVNTGDIMRGLSIYSAWGSAGASAIVENLTGRLLASPRFARWLARPAADAGTRMRRLAQIMAREPQLSADIIPIQRALEGGTRAAAAQDTQDSR